VETAEETVQNRPEAAAPEDRAAVAAASEGGGPIHLEPDLDFIRALGKQGGQTLKKCFQCGTCSAACALAPEVNPFPRKEMAWAVWGMKDRLLRDPDVWLCHQCNDCSTRCPRGARPGDVLGAIRQECVTHYAVPRFLGEWAGQPQCIPLLLGIPAALLAIAMLLKNDVEEALGIGHAAGEAVNAGGEKIIFSHSHMFPHWLLNSFFFFFSILAALAMIAGVRRFWRALQAGDPQGGSVPPAKGLGASIAAALGSVVIHDKFTSCTRTDTRYWSHLCVFFGFAALCLVTFWVITAKVNPFIQPGFIYPFGLFSPWKILANVGGAAILAGGLWMILDRLRNIDENAAGAGSYFDWALIATLLIVVLSGFVTEALHFVRLEPHRHLAYFVHLVFVFALLIYLPYSKFAHIVYRTTAMVYAEHTGRGSGPPPAPTAGGETIEKEQDHAAAGSQ
jgi:quinone-modifying oxidoreductase subunit QmoC